MVFANLSKRVGVTEIDVQKIQETDIHEKDV